LASSSSNTLQPDSTKEEETKQQQQQSALLNLYIVVDRLAIPPADILSSSSQDDELDDSNNSDSNNNQNEGLFLFHWHQEDLAQSLARQVATHSQLRPLLQGITVGVTNHSRATPGLDAIATLALSFGGEDRYRFGTNSVSNNNDNGMDTDTIMSPPQSTNNGKSLISIVASSSDALLGWHSDINNDADADAQTTSTMQYDCNTVPLNQFRVVAEWNAQGNLQTFGQRAHAQWRRNMGLWEQPLCVGPARKPVTRKQLVMRRPLVSVASRNTGVVSISGAVATITSYNEPIMTLNRSGGKAPGPPPPGQGYNPAIARRQFQESATNVAVMLMLGYYLWFHYRNDMHQLYSEGTMALMEFVQYLRAL
jgi:hypothetical protein